MKKIYNILALLLLVFTFGGCTLSMEEWLDEPATSEVPEEKRGVDAPYTETIPDVITVTYKYNPGVRPVTTKHRGYLAHIEADTILYFYDNMPKELLPLEGEYLAAGSAPQYPDGLNHRVLTVERAGGLYKVVMTKATVDEVYDDLVYELDVAYNPPLNDYMEVEDTTQVEYANGNSEPEIIQDWTLYNQVKEITDEDVRYIRRANQRSRIHTKTRTLTRAEVKDTTQKDTTTSWGFTYRFDFGNTTAPEKRNWYERVFHDCLFNYVSANKDKWADATYYFELSYKNNTRVRSYSLVNKKEKYEKTFTEKTETSKFGVAVGLDYGKKYKLVDEKSNFAATNPKPNFVDLKKLDGYLKHVTPQQKLNNKLKTMGFKLVIPCAVPVTMVFKFGFDVQWKFNGNLAAFLETETVSLEGYEYINGKKSPLQNPENKPTTTNTYSVVGSGSANFTFIPSASVGIQFGGSLGADIGVKGTWKLLDFNAELGYDFNVPGEVYKKATLGSSFFVNPFVTFYVTLFRWELWDQTITFDKNWKIYNFSRSINPVLYVSEVPGRMDVGINAVSLNYCYGVTSTGIGFGYDKLLPRLAIFKNEVYDFNLVAHVKPNNVSANEAIKGSKAYWFEYKFDENNPYNAKNKYIAVPALYDPNDESYTYYTIHKYLYQAVEPKMKIVGIAQESATDAYSDFNFSDESDLVEYKFAVELDASATKLAKDYGIMVSIPKLGIESHMISLKKYTMYSTMTNVVSVSFFSDYVAEDWNLKINVSPYVVNEKGIYSFGDEELLEIGYPMEYQKYTSDKRSPVQINATIE